MAMSKKDFIALADALRAEKPGTNWNPNKMVQWELDVKAVARRPILHLKSRDGLGISKERMALVGERDKL